MSSGNEDDLEILKDTTYESQESEVHQNIFQDPEEAHSIGTENVVRLYWCQPSEFSSDIYTEVYLTLRRSEAESLQ